MPEERYKELVGKLRDIVSEYEEYNPDATDVSKASAETGVGKEYGAAEDKVADVYSDSGSEMDKGSYVGDTVEEEEAEQSKQMKRKPLKQRNPGMY